jgi:hypothetical protein
MKWLIVPAIALALLKIFGVIALDWIWVTLPIWILPAIFIAAMTVGLMLLLLLAIFGNGRE